MTTAAVAKRMGRHYLTIEKELEYCQYGERRLSSITPVIGDIEKAVYDEKPLRVTMREMIAAGYFIAGETFYLKDFTEGGKLQPDGKLLYDGKIMDMHSCAALVKGSRAKRLNGFKVWYVLRNDGLVNIDAVRESYRKFKREMLAGGEK